MMDAQPIERENLQKEVFCSRGDFPHTSSIIRRGVQAERVYDELCQNITLCSVLLKNRKRGEIYALVTSYCRYQWHARDDF
jgi:hypothetical protein